MNKTINGELQMIIALAEGAQGAGDFEELEQITVIMAEHWHKLVKSVNQARPAKEGWLLDQVAKSSFEFNIAKPAYRPVFVGK